MKQLTFLLMAISLAACSNTPQSHYYLINSKATDAEFPCNCSIGIGPVTVAEYLNRPQITTSAEPGQLNIEQFHRWGEPLRHNIERTLLENLATLSDSSQLAVHPWRQNQRPEYRVSINVLTMDRSGDSATIKVQWRLLHDEKLIQQNLETYRSPLANNSYPALANGFSLALLQLSRAIGAQILDSTEGAATN